MAVIEIARIQVRRGQESVTGIPQLESGEFGWAGDTERLYIGKRIVDGAKDDDNTRILTENDLVNVFSMIAPGSAISSTSSYRYRDSLSDAAFANITTIPENYGTRPYITIGKKLDQVVSLIDFLPVWPPAGNDITEVANAALKDIYANTFTNMQRTLLIPAGTYIVSDYLDLPPQTKLLGEGTDITTLVLINDSVNLMRTVDKLGNAFGNMTNNQAVNPKNIHVEGMTLAYSTGITTNLSLISLDNVKDAVVKSVKFETLGVQYDDPFTITTTTNVTLDPTELAGSGFNVVTMGNTKFNPSQDGIYFITGSSAYLDKYARITSYSLNAGYYTMLTTSSFGIMDFTEASEQYTIWQYDAAGSGISIRASYDPAGNNNQLSENIQITDSTFDYLGACIIANTSGTNRINVTNSRLMNSLEGIKLYTDSTSTVDNGPTNCQISNNRFENIYEKGLFVGSNPNGAQGNVTSAYNHYIQVGNGVEQYFNNVSDTNITSKSFPVIEFGSGGNLSTNDYFGRMDAATTATANISFYYNKIVSGATNIQNQQARVGTVPGNTGIAPVVSFPITNTEQFIEVKYQMFNNSLSRKGTVSLNLRGNIFASAYASVSDTYVYTEEQTPFSGNTTNMVAGPGSAFDSLIIDDPATTATLAIIYNQNINGGNSSLYVTGSNQFAGFAAYVTSIVDLGGGAYQLVTQSANPQFDYSPNSYPAETWTLLTADTPIFSTVVNTGSNYVTLVCDTSASSADRSFNIEFQTNIFQK